MARVHIDAVRAAARKKALKEGMPPEEAERLIVESYKKANIEIDYSAPAKDETDLDFTGSFNFGASAKPSDTPTGKS